MIYEYWCNGCNTQDEVIKSAKEIENPESCKQCGELMERKFCFRGQVGVSQFTEGYNPGLGKSFKNKHELKDEIRRLNYETGARIEEVGTSKVSSTPRKKEIPYELAQRAYKEMRAARGR